VHTGVPTTPEDRTKWCTCGLHMYMRQSAKSHVSVTCNTEFHPHQEVCEAVRDTLLPNYSSVQITAMFDLA
jgi:hypothetical protein